MSFTEKIRKRMKTEVFEETEIPLWEIFATEPPENEEGKEQVIS